MLRGSFLTLEINEFKRYEVNFDVFAGDQNCQVKNHQTKISLNSFLVEFTKLVCQLFALYSEITSHVSASCDMVTLHSISCVYIVCVCVFGGYKETKNKIKIRVQ